MEVTNPKPKEPKAVNFSGLIALLISALAGVSAFLVVMVLEQGALLKEQEAKLNDLTAKLYFVKPGGVDRLARRAEINEKRLDVLVKRLGGTPTYIEHDYKDQLNNGLPGEDEWPMTLEEFKELQRKLREQMEKEKKT